MPKALAFPWLAPTKRGTEACERIDEVHPSFFNQAALFFGVGTPLGPGSCFSSAHLSPQLPFLQDQSQWYWQERLPACLHKTLCSWSFAVPC